MFIESERRPSAGFIWQQFKKAYRIDAISEIKIYGYHYLIYNASSLVSGDGGRVIKTIIIMTSPAEEFNRVLTEASPEKLLTFHQ